MPHDPPAHDWFIIIPPLQPPHEPQSFMPPQDEQLPQDISGPHMAPQPSITTPPQGMPPQPQLQPPQGLEHIQPSYRGGRGLHTAQVGSLQRGFTQAYG